MLVLDSLELNKTARRPVWLMRQAGRYMKAYRDLRQKYTFDDFAHQAELATEVSLQPLKQYELDASIVFSDILIPIRALGVPLHFTEKGPVLESPKTKEEFQKIRKEFNPEEDTPTILQTLKNLRAEIPAETALLGFCGAPFTMVAYLVEGKLTKDLGTMKQWMAKEPQLIHDLLQTMATQMGGYLEAQAQAGANAVQMFDSWAGVLSAKDFEEFALPYARQVVSEVTVPCIYYINNGGHLLQQCASVGAQGLSVDWRVPLGDVKKQLPRVFALQGNLDPYHLHLPHDQIRERVFEMCSSYGTEPGHIVNLGHGMVPSIPEDSVKVFIDSVREWSAQML